MGLKLDAANARIKELEEQLELWPPIPPNYMKVPTTIREALDVIDTFIITEPHGNELWNILSGLRGPDHEDDELKGRTTDVIRATALPKSRGRVAGAYAGVGIPFDSTGLTKNKPHFCIHVQWAARGLGLKDTAAKPAAERF